MRMWNVDPRLLCRRHLTGEHVEMHMFIGTLESEKSVRGYVEKGLVEVHNIIKRHDELATEMTRRGMKHRSPIETWVALPEMGKVDVQANLKDLRERCGDCAELQQLVAA